MSSSADSHKAVLDREDAIQTAKHFKDSLDLANELLNYGTNLVPRAFVSSPRDLKAICLIFVQLRQFLVNLDGVITLAAVGNCETATVQLRSLLEKAHMLEWILITDTDPKIHHLYVANLRRRHHSNSILIPGTPEASRNPSGVTLVTLSPDQLKNLAVENKLIQTRLASPPFDAINAKFEPIYVKRFYDAPWYEVYAAPAIPKLSIRKIGEDIGRVKEYAYIYTSFSAASHGSDMWKSIAAGDQDVKMSPIREPQNIPETLRLATSLALRVFRLIIKEYRAGEEENFDRKYVQEWRDRFLKRYNVVVMPQDLKI